jgi:hypothetical protein
MSDTTAEQTSRQQGFDALWAIFRAIFRWKQRRTTDAAQDLYSALADSETLLKYASEAGIAVDAESVSIIVRAKQAPAASWGDQDHGKVYEALTKLAVATKPVTAATLRASGGRARASLRFYRGTAFSLAVFIIPLSILSFISSGLSVAIGKDISDGNDLALALNSYISTPPPGPAPASQPTTTPMPPDTRAKLQQFAAIIRGIDARARQLNFISGDFVTDSDLDSVRTDPCARKSLFELNTGSLEGIRGHGDCSLVKPLEIADQIKQKIDFYQDVRYFAKRTQEAAQLAYGAVAACILPILYALLGACASLLRIFADQTRDRTYLSSFANPARLLIAAIGGVVVGLFNINIGQAASLSPFGIAFLVGYASDAFFSFMDGLLQSLTKPKNAAVTPQRA